MSLRGVTKQQPAPSTAPALGSSSAQASQAASKPAVPPRPAKAKAGAASQRDTNVKVRQNAFAQPVKDNDVLSNVSAQGRNQRAQRTGGGGAMARMPTPQTNKSARKAPANHIIRQGQGVKDSRFDGAFVDKSGRAWSAKTDWTKLQGVKPNNGMQPSGKCLYVNGMNCDLKAQHASMQKIANTTGSEVVGIHNGTSGGFVDLLECVGDKMNISNNGAHKTLKETAYNHITNHPSVPLNIVAHSQGGIIASRALTGTRNKIQRDFHQSKDDARLLMGRTNVQTAGAAAFRYPVGPNYRHLANRKDPIPQLAGQDLVTNLYKKGTVDSGPKRGEVITFDQGNKNPLNGGIGNQHGMDQVYVDKLIPFNQIGY